MFCDSSRAVELLRTRTFLRTRVIELGSRLHPRVGLGSPAAERAAEDVLRDLDAAGLHIVHQRTGDWGAGPASDYEGQVQLLPDEAFRLHLPPDERGRAVRGLHLID